MCRLCANQTEHDQKVATSKAMADRQRHYDRLHHLMRIEWLESLAKHDVVEAGLLKQSRRVIADASDMQGYNSVDCSDVEYIAELDAFEAQLTQAAA